MRSNFEHCAALVREADRDRYLATLFAPADRRDALHALYAFAVEIARIRDMARNPMPGEIRLQWWRDVLCGERAGEAAAHPVAAALGQTIRQYGFVVTPLMELINARTFDLYDEPMASIGALEVYAVHTQSPVFAMAAGILGAGRPLPELFTLDVAAAYTIGTILTAFARHAAQGRLCVPAEILERHRVKPQDIFAGYASDGLRAALAEMHGLAHSHLSLAQEKLKSEVGDLLPALLPLAPVGAQLRRLQRADYDPFKFTPLPLWRRQWLIWRAARNPKRTFI